MELVYVRYIPKDSKALLLELGTRNNKLCGLLADKVPDSERAKITSSRTILDALSVDRKILWLKDHCPISYRTAYREMHNHNAQVISRHTITK
jgi:hypothetical protein